MRMQFDISAVTPAHSAKRYFWPIQSNGQLFSFAVFVIAGLIAMSIIVHLLEPSIPQVGLAIAGFIGATFSLYAVLPGRLHISANSGLSELRELLHQHIVQSSYVAVEAVDAFRRYRAPGPRWLRWEESAIAMHMRDDSTIIIEGPVLTLQEIRRWLCQRK